MPTRYCADCGKGFVQGSGTPSTYCPRCRSKPEHGYGGTHRTLRAEWQKRMDAGEIVTCGEPRCLHESRFIVPGTPWDMGHRADGAESPSHADCNRSAGARSKARVPVPEPVTGSARAMENKLMIGMPLPQTEHRSPQWRPGDVPPTVSGDWRQCTCLYTVQQSGFMPTTCW